MKRLFSVAVMVLALGMSASAQLQYRSWNKGPLTWHDFQVLRNVADAKAFEQSAHPEDTLSGVAEELASGSWLQYTFRLKHSDTLANGITADRTRVVACMEPRLSWVAAESMTDKELHYNQVVFNLCEIQCRMFQPEFDRGSAPDQDLLESVGKYAQSDEMRFNYESGYGADSAVVERWLDSTNRLLAELPEKAELKISYIKDWGVGAHIGAGYSLYLGGTGWTFRNPLSFDFGFEGIYGRSSWMMEMLIGGAGTKQHFDLDGVVFASGERYTWLQMFLGYGYYLLQKPRYNLMPMVGYGLSMIGANYSAEDMASEGCGSWIAGIVADYNFSNHISDVFYDGTRMQEVYGLRMMLYASGSKLYGYNEPMINLAVALNFGAHPIKLR